MSINGKIYGGDVLAQMVGKLEPITLTGGGERMSVPKRKIETMYERYGRHDGRKCRDCVNLVRYSWRRASYRKCAAYGDTRSEATDWALKYDACGLFGIPFPDGMRPMIEIKKHDANICPDQPVEGQIGFDEIEVKE